MEPASIPPICISVYPIWLAVPMISAVENKEIRSKLHLEWIPFSHSLGEAKAFPVKEYIGTFMTSPHQVCKHVIEVLLYSTFILQNPFMKEARPILKSFHSWSTLLTRVIKVNVLILAFIQLHYAKAHFMNMAIVWRATNRLLSSEYFEINLCDNL